ncbi:hypothetical protein ENC19_23545 [Verrucosispora sp. CWR15]|uniref:Uncharacterized protein n=1 Tax=Verrucosispora sioxanthis TaxID=2499994 RepID=A0A6M1LB38_9ACTN|nr:hypothetical protein [Verrucosispora sioxanthis]NEE66287.1 hypothetical protein [Verrucosispora sioxanthis]NGM15397.1 hypothetical protein [Verrucosispora sioxanthis]
MLPAAVPPVPGRRLAPDIPRPDGAGTGGWAGGAETGRWAGGAGTERWVGGAETGRAGAQRQVQGAAATEGAGVGGDGEGDDRLIVQWSRTDLVLVQRRAGRTSC